MRRTSFDADIAARALLSCRRIAVLGSGGAGKSTVARAIAARVGLPLHHLDRLYWLPGWQATPDPDWEALQRELVREERWMVDGNYSRTLAIRLDRADGVLLLDLPRRVCLWRAFWRSMRLYGKVRPDLGAGCPEHFDLEFLAWIWAFPRRTRGKLLAAKRAAPPGQAWVVPRTAREVRRLIRAIEAATPVPPRAGRQDGSIRP